MNKSYSVGKGEFWTIEAFEFDVNEALEDGYITEGERYEDIDTYYCESVNDIALDDFVGDLIDTYQPDTIIRINCVPRRYADFIYNHDEEYFEEVTDYGEDCLGGIEMVYDGNKLMSEEEFLESGASALPH